MKIINCLLLCLMLAITLITCSSNGTDTLEAAGPNGGYKMPNPKNTTQYDSWWQEIQEFQNKGLPKSALETVTKVYDFAKKENNASQLVKAIIHKMRFLQEVEEETLIKVQKELLTELKESTFPVTPLLHSMLADQYWQYYANNRYRFHKRSATAGIKPDDIRTWDLKTIVKECVTHFHKSLEGAEEQKKLKIDIYQDILYPKEVTRKYRPTLYDFLAHRAVDFFMDNESGLTQPVYRFTLNNPDYFAPCDEFARQKIDTRDPLSFHFYAVSILQNLVEFHLKDAAPDALVDVDLKRLRFLYNEAVVGNKTIIYEKVLRGLMDEYKGVPVVAEVYYELAKLYMELGAKYVPGKDETYKWHLKKARLLCIDACETYPGSIGAHNCAHLQNRIEGKSLHLKMESGILPATPTPALVSYKNIDTLYFRLFKTDKKEMEANGRKRQDQLVSYFLVQDPVKSWDISLINDGDFQQHAAETKMEVGETGMYVLLASDTPSFDYRQKVVSYSFFNVSRISYLHKSLRGNGLDVYVVDRESGQPLAGTGVRLWFNVYNRAKRSYIPLKGPELETDAYGFVNIGVGKTRDKGFHLEFTKDGDTLYSKRQFHLSQSFREPSPRTRTFFFTDRSIYRPGQTVHFKGLMLKVDGKNGEQTHIMENHNTTVILQDVNSQKVAQLQLRSNDYGTFSGSFQLPVGQLNGIMRIYDSYGNANISVEEYKRPKFQVEFPPAEASYKLDDNVIIKGKAEAYAGYNIDNAEVKYRVVRHVFYPYRWRCWGYYPRTPQMEILSGVTKTDAKGEFEVSFKAVPDLTIDKERQPAFNFVVEVDITDINGETRSGSKGIAVGYTALKVGISLPDQLDKEQAQKGFALTTTSLSGDFTAAKGTVSFYRLKEPTRVTRRKLWTAPDRFTLSREKYHKLFPYDYYAEEAEVTQWEKEKRVFHSNFDTAELKELKVAGIKKWHSGKYLAEMNSKDRYGAPVKDMVYFTLYSPKDKKVPYTQLDWCTLPRTMVEPGEKAVLLVGSSAKNINAFYEIEYRGRIISKKFLDPGNRQKKIEIPIEEKHRGNIGVHLTFIKYNRVFTRSYVITVPWSDRELDISFATFRDKLSPGEKEEWRIKIKAKNGKGEKIAAEMLAGLYDASLDAFRPHNWYFSIFPHHSITQRWAGDNFFNLLQTTVFGQLVRRSSVMHKYYDSLNWFGFYWRSHPIRYKSKGRMERSRRPGAVMAEAETMPPPPLKMSKKMAAPQSAAVGGALEDADVGVMKEELSLASVESADKPTDTTKEPDLSAVKARTNLQETAFFFPHLKTDGDGNIIVAFTIPEALTKWKMMGFAHTKELQYGRITNSLVTQKELMVVPNAPRFFREGDTLRFVTKITNLSGKAMEGKAKLMLLDAAEMKPVDAKFKNDSAERKFSIAQDQSTTVEWALEIPEDIDAVTYRVVAAAGKFSDGEEQAVPILKNRMLVTETMPLPVRAGQEKVFNFKKLMESAKSTTLKHHKLTLEFTANPVWYAVQALPYLAEYPHDCMEQVFSRFYANSMAGFILDANPGIKKVFDIWKSAEGGNALLSNLEKNQELKTLLLEETPWVLDAQDESQRKKRIALLFDINKMASQLARALKKLKEGQMASGAWPWFNGMRENRYITQHIVCGFAHLHALGVVDAVKNKTIQAMLREAVPYLDRAVRDDYDWLKKHSQDLEKMHIGHIQVHYLYARSYFPDIPRHADTKDAFAYYKGQAEKYWLRFNKYSQGMIALAMNRFGNKTLPKAIAASIKEHALYSEEMGMYWKDSYGYYWYQSAIETHALLIEMFSEVMEDRKSVDELRTWLLKQKQTQDWGTTKATADACFALLINGTQWLTQSQPPDITVGKIKIDPKKIDGVKVEAGTGYFKTSWPRDEITPDMGRITVKNNNEVVAWGGVYWQYFENLDKITPAETPLKLKKQLMVERPSDTGPVLHPLSKKDVKIGDRIKVRIELRVDRNMEYVHMKDMRASGFEPEDVISMFKRQDGLGYYQSTKDASTNFFFDYLPKGTYVFEYALRVSHAGDFSNGITSIQCMYAPEFSSHSQGVRVEIK